MTYQEMYRSALFLNGKCLSYVNRTEGLINALISVHFMNGGTGPQQSEFMKLIMQESKIGLSEKKDILRKILHEHYPADKDKVSNELFKKFVEQRNFIAHSMIRIKERTDSIYNVEDVELFISTNRVKKLVPFHQQVLDTHQTLHSSLTTFELMGHFADPAGPDEDEDYLVL